MTAAAASVSVNRAPVLTLWAAVVARRLGFAWPEALTLGRAVAGLNAYSKGVSLGIFKPTPEAVRKRRKLARAGTRLRVALLGRMVPVARTRLGLLAAAKGRSIAPASVERYLHAKFGKNYGAVRTAMADLARSYPPRTLAGAAYRLYTRFRPDVPSGAGGWGARGRLSLARIRALKRKA